MTLECAAITATVSAVSTTARDWPVACKVGDGVVEVVACSGSKRVADDRDCGAVWLCRMVSRSGDRNAGQTDCRP